MTKIKFCGLTRYEDILYVNDILPDYAGFVFVRKSRRYISPEKAALLRKTLHGKIKSVGVFADEPLDNILALTDAGIIDIVQLHGNEPSGYIDVIHNKADVPVIKAFNICGMENLCGIQSNPADFLLLDSASAGSGTVFDWNLIKTVNRPFFLAGGLNESNVSKAIDLLHPYAVDVSSGIETDGFKDKIKMQKFYNEVKERNDKL